MSIAQYHLSDFRCVNNAENRVYPSDYQGFIAIIVLLLKNFSFLRKFEKTNLFYCKITHVLTLSLIHI